ncbi:unnamed protein product, partial [marine sediment metagenome]
GFAAVTAQALQVDENDTANVAFSVSPEPAKLTIQCSTANAAVSEGGRLIGAAGVPLNLSPYVKHSLEVSAPGFRPRRISVDAPSPGQTIGKQTVRLEAQSGSLLITATSLPTFSRRLEATIILDQKSLGDHSLPYEAKSVSVGDHTVELHGRIWEPVQSQRLSVKDRVKTTLSFKLVPRKSFFRFSVSPRGADLTVDGKRADPTSVFQAIPGKRHEIVARMKDYTTYSTRERLDFGETKHITINLRKKDVVIVLR